MLGELSSGALTLRELRRFPNEPVRSNGSLQWDVLRLWHDMRGAFDEVGDAGLDSVGVDTWGCDFALLANAAICSRIPIITATPAMRARWMRSAAAWDARRSTR